MAEQKWELYNKIFDLLRWSIIVPLWRLFDPNIYTAASYIGSTITVAKFRHQGVLWKLEVASDIFGFQDLNPEHIADEDLIIQSAPLCPVCGTELEERWIVFRQRFEWRCISCGLKRFSRVSFYKEGKRCEKVAKSHRQDWIPIDERD